MYYPDGDLVGKPRMNTYPRRFRRLDEGYWESLMVTNEISYDSVVFTMAHTVIRGLPTDGDK